MLADLLGTVAFAISGAAAARERRLDVFGVYAVAFVTACGGGIVRDICLGALPPMGISDWRYLACSAFASTIAIWAAAWVERLKQPVTFFDSLGLGTFAVVGAHRALLHGANIEAAIVLGVVAAVGGGVLRDVLLNRVPAILAREIYALAALVAAVIQVVSEVNGWGAGLTPGSPPACASSSAFSPCATPGGFRWSVADKPKDRHRGAIAYRALRRLQESASVRRYDTRPAAAVYRAAGPKPLESDVRQARSVGKTSESTRSVTPHERSLSWLPCCARRTSLCWRTFGRFPGHATIHSSMVMRWAERCGCGGFVTPRFPSSEAFAARVKTREIPLGATPASGATPTTC